MKPRIVFTAFVAVLVGCSPPADRAPQRPAFQVNGRTYEWQLAHGVAGSLSIVRTTSAGQGVPYIVMTCHDRRRGAVQLRGDLARAGKVKITAGDVAFSADTALRGASSGIGPITTGEGYFEPNWFQALATADVITVSSDSRIFEAPGPGAAADHYKRYCTKLARRRDPDKSSSGPLAATARQAFHG
jgi:hypothetical protein